MNTVQIQTETPLWMVANRGDNLLATAILGLGGVAFGGVVFQEQDWTDKVDDAGFLVIALAMSVWYLWPGTCFRRSLIPVLTSGFAMVVQIAGFALERDDPKAFGDNIGGLVFFGSALVLILAQRWGSRAVVRRLGGELLNGPHSSSTPR
jgi:hypothetical protein